MQVLLNGLVSGGIIAVIALSFSFAYFPTGIFHLALGGVYVVAPYLLLAFFKAGCGWIPSAAMTVLICGILSAACELLNHRPLTKKAASSNVHLVSSLGLYIVLSQTVALIWGNDPRTLRLSSDSVYTLAGLNLTRSQCYEVLVSVVTLTLVFFVLRKTRLGLTLRGLADNPREMMLSGANIWNMRLFAFFLSGVFVGCASLSSAYDYGFDPNSGLTTLFLGVVAVMIGGRELFWSPLLGGLALGVLRSEAVWVFSARWQEAATFTILGLVLIFRPNGLFGTVRRLESR